MATTDNRARQTKITNTQPQPNKKLQLRSNLFTFVAAFTGVAVGVFASLAMVAPMIRSEFATQSQKLSQQLLSAAPAAATLSACTVPADETGSTAGSGAAAVQTATAVKPGGGAGGGSSTSTVFVHKLVSGIWAKDTATISNTGTDSENEVSFTNTNTTTVSNDNDLSATNNNPQYAQSGNASASHNTTAGQTASGTATNDSDMNVTFKVVN